MSQIPDPGMNSDISSKLGKSRPVDWQLRKLTGLILINGRHAEGPETKPSAARGAMADKPKTFPPGTDEGLVDSFRIAMKFQLEIDPLHSMATAGVRADWIVIVNLR
jgi:hypothetical protein